MQEEVARSRVSLEPTESGLRAVYRFASDLSVFAGHFPGSPLVPGVYLIEAVRQSAEAVVKGSLFIAEVCDARYTAPVAPDAELRLEVALAVVEGEPGARTWTAKASLVCAERQAAKLRLRLRERTG